MNVHVPHKPKTARQVTAAKIACSAFWSLRHPLNQAYQRAYGKTVEGVFYPANGFALRQLVEFAEELPPEILLSYADEAASAPFSMIEG